MAIPDVDRAVQASATPTLLPPPRPTIVPATDLGGVGVLKHGNLYLLSDQFGDVHPDSRGLGLYDATPAHGPFVHVDTRGRRVRWGP